MTTSLSPSEVAERLVVSQQPYTLAPILADYEALRRAVGYYRDMVGFSGAPNCKCPHCSMGHTLAILNAKLEGVLK